MTAALSHSLAPIGVRCLRAARETHGPRPLKTVSGAIPADLNGRLYRVGPGRFERDGAPLGHWFDGEGLCVMVELAGGAATATVRYVADEARADYAALGRLGVAPSFVRRLRSVWSWRDYANLANTALLFWGERLFALYEAAAPVEIDPDTLDVVGETDLGVVRRAFSAHPKRHRPSGAWINQGFRVLPSPAMDYYALRPDGRAARLGAAAYKGGSLTHDFALTDRWIATISPPAFARKFDVLFRGVALSEGLDWRGDEPTEIVLTGIGPNGALEPARRARIEAPSFFYSHTAQAFDDGEDVVIHGVAADDGGGMEWVKAIRPDATSLPRPSPMRLVEIRLSPNRGTATTRVLAERRIDFPAVDAAAPRARYVYAAGFADEAAAYTDFFDAWVKIDVETGAAQPAAPISGEGSRRFVSEPTFVPRPDPKAEDDGWILSLFYDADADETRLAIVDAFGDAWGAPVAEVSLGQPLPMSFHGVWRPASEP